MNHYEPVFRYSITKRFDCFPNTKGRVTEEYCVRQKDNLLLTHIDEKLHVDKVCSESKTAYTKYEHSDTYIDDYHALLNFFVLLLIRYNSFIHFSQNLDLMLIYIPSAQIVILSVYSGFIASLFKLDFSKQNR